MYTHPHYKLYTHVTNFLYTRLQLSCSVMQCVAVCCSVLQCVTECCSVLQCVAVSCSSLYTPTPAHANDACVCVYDVHTRALHTFSTFLHTHLCISLQTHTMCVCVYTYNPLTKYNTHLTKYSINIVHKNYAQNIIHHQTQIPTVRTYIYYCTYISMFTVVFLTFFAIPRSARTDFKLYLLAPWYITGPVGRVWRRSARIVG